MLNLKIHKLQTELKLLIKHDGSIKMTHSGILTPFLNEVIKTKAVDIATNVSKARYEDTSIYIIPSPTGSAQACTMPRSTGRKIWIKQLLDTLKICYPAEVLATVVQHKDLTVLKLHTRKVTSGETRPIPPPTTITESTEKPILAVPPTNTSHQAKNIAKAIMKKKKENTIVKKTAPTKNSAVIGLNQSLHSGRTAAGVGRAKRKYTKKKA